MVHCAFVRFAFCFLSFPLLPLHHHCFTHTHLQETEVNAILQDIAKSRQNILQCLNGVSTVLQMSHREPPPRRGRTVLSNICVPALQEGNVCF